MRDNPPGFNVDRLEAEARAQKQYPCHVCGKATYEEFFGFPCCDPYDDNGRRASKCKEWLRDNTGWQS